MIGRLRRSSEWRLLGVLGKAHPRLAFWWWLLVLVRGLLPAAFTVAMGVVVGAVLDGDSLAAPLAVLGAVFVVSNALGPLHDAIAADLGARAGAWLHDRLMEACVDPPGLAHLERAELADEMAAAREFDLGISAPPLDTALPQIGSGFAEITSGLAQAGVLAAYRWWAAVLVAGAWLATHVLLRESGMWKVWDSPEVLAEQRHVDYAYKLTVDAPAAKEIRLFGLADWAVARFADRRRRLTDALFHARRLRQRPLTWSLLAVVAANGLVLWSLARDASAGALELDMLVVFAQATVGTAALAFGEFDWWFRGSAQPIPKVVGLADEMRGPGALRSGTRNAAGHPAREIRFENVTFAYRPGAKPVLDGFDLTIAAGQSLAIVGQNGAGKTTLAKLVCRLYDPQDGAVVVDGTDLRDFDLDSWRARLAAVFQDFVRYELPLRDNVAPGGASDADIWRALEAAQAGDLAGLDVILSKAYVGGTDLSGGQWQRVALARAMCAVQAGAGVVLLDEPTAQLDVRGEAEIFDRILEATRGRTTILISHRFSTVRHADRICVLENGRVVELGSHDELLARGGRYRTMFEMQASKFAETDGSGS